MSDAFFQDLQIPNTDQAIQDELEKDKTPQVFSVAISSLKSGKSPGPDGLLIEFYKTFSNGLTPFLSLVFAESFKYDRLPPSF